MAFLSQKQGGQQAMGKAMSGGERPPVNKPEQAPSRGKDQHGQPGPLIDIKTKHGPNYSFESSQPLPGDSKSTFEKLSPARKVDSGGRK